MVVPVNDSDIYSGMAEAMHYLDATEPGSYHYDARPFTCSIDQAEKCPYVTL